MNTKIEGKVRKPSRSPKLPPGHFSDRPTSDATVLPQIEEHPQAGIKPSEQAPDTIPRTMERPPRTVSREPVNPPHTTEEEVPCCDIKETDSNSPRAFDIKVSQSWDEASDIRSSIWDSVARDGTWNSEGLGTAVAFSEGAAVGGSVTAGARVILLGDGGQKYYSNTEEIRARTAGQTRVHLDIIGPDGATPEDCDTAISSAVLNVLEGHAYLPDFPEWLLYVQGATSFVSGLLAPRAGEVLDIVADWVLNGEVHVEVKSSLAFRVGNCAESSGELNAMAFRDFLLVEGNLEKPDDGAYYMIDCPAGLASCTVSNGMDILMQSKVEVSGSAHKSYLGTAYLNSLWACAWAWECQCGENDTTGWGWRFNMRITIPPDVMDALQRRGFSDSKEIQIMLRLEIEEKLNSILAEQGFASPIQEPVMTEAQLRKALTDWFSYLQDEWLLFPDAYFGGVE